MKSLESHLLKILRIGHESSIRGTGISLREALALTRYSELRPSFSSADLLPLIEADSQFIDEWLAYSQDKRTSYGWHLLEQGQIGQSGSPTPHVFYNTMHEAVADYVIQELDFWTGVERVT